MINIHEKRLSCKIGNFLGLFLAYFVFCSLLYFLILKDYLVFFGIKLLYFGYLSVVFALLFLMLLITGSFGKIWKAKAAVDVKTEIKDMLIDTKPSGFKEFFNGVYEGSKLFGYSAANIINSILLAVVYFVGVGPVSVIGRLLGKRFLDLEKDITPGSYWKERKQEKLSKDDHYRQF